MKVTVFSCGIAVNESEVIAIEHLKRQLQNLAGNDEWCLLTNLAFSVTHQFQSDEIDIIAIGPQGVRVIEVKHWSAAWVDTNAAIVEHESEKLTNKSRKIGTTLRKIIPDLPRVDGVFLLTQATPKVKKLAGQTIRGNRFCLLNQWKEVIGVDNPRVLTSQQVSSLCHILAPKIGVAFDGSLRRLAGYVNLELQTPKDQRFHRIYKGSHPARRDRVVLHLYDLTVSDEANSEVRAKREVEALQQLQLFRWAPRILDSWQAAPGYAGEIFFFTVVDPAAPSIEIRANDLAWNTSSRLLYARDAIRALIELHQAGGKDVPFIHRNLTPQSLLVRYDNSPIFTGFDRTKIPSEISVASSSPPVTDHPNTVPPEIRLQGLAAADQRSDVYSICSSLAGLFAGNDDNLSLIATEILDTGCAKEPEGRAVLEEIERALSELLGDSTIAPLAPPARYWTEDQTIRFNGRDYKIITRLGSGGVGTTFKVVEIDRGTKEELGTYVAKTVHDSETGKRVLKSYSLTRSHLGRDKSLSPIYEFALEWSENQFIALLGWIEGTPLNEFTGIFQLLAEEQDENSAEALAIRFLQQLCEALTILHRNGLVHGDISPRNMIVSGSSIVLTDYDFVTRIGDVTWAPGTVEYCSSAREQLQPASPQDDLSALAASFFHVLFDKEPYRYSGELNKRRGLNWSGIDRDAYPILADVLDRATNPNASKCFASAIEFSQALITTKQNDNSKYISEQDTQRIQKTIPFSSLSEGTNTKVIDVETTLSEQRIEWLKHLLQSYPGSQWGNKETRGLDSKFAADTYVPTELENALAEDIRVARVRLVILCGNAGDGKTALLQHLALELGLGQHSSADRILEGKVPNGPIVRMNLDGSASWKGKSADEILDDFLAPFLDGPPKDNIVHLLAVNDGRLLEWIESIEERHNKRFALTEALHELLQQENGATKSYIRFISLNQRSLVGGISLDKKEINTRFLERLVDQLYGASRAADIWSPCHICSAKDRCKAFQSAMIFGPKSLSSYIPEIVRRRARTRLFEAFQAVHLRGETHITMRELRAALIYILFGVNYCDEYHDGTCDQDNLSPPYWDRAFAHDSPARQGEVLAELARFDPALESHPQLDRYLQSQAIQDSDNSAPRYPDLELKSARRRAYFEWIDNDYRTVLRDSENSREDIALSRGRHLRDFRNLPLIQDPHELLDITRRLCAGISRLEDLPLQALERVNVVPLRITPRTPTETAFWVEKRLQDFRIEPVLPPKSDGVELLHRQVALIYQYRDGNQERLFMGAELFHLLLELADGYQLGDVSTDDTFAHLSIFVQRLVRESERELLAWNPMQDERLYELSAAIDPDKMMQQLSIKTTTD